VKANAFIAAWARRFSQRLSEASTPCSAVHSAPLRGLLRLPLLLPKFLILHPIRHFTLATTFPSQYTSNTSPSIITYFSLSETGLSGSPQSASASSVCSRARNRA
jgi:hypothetical protein